jgi:tetratricopeptide (TPR) repeat protein
MKKFARPTVVLCGAGISLDEPSRLPSAAKLARKAVDLLLASDDVALDAEAVRALKKAVRAMRLELTMERLSLQVDAATLVQVYGALCGAEPNFNHLALASLDLAVVTTNQDLLLEAAADRLCRRREIVHLHGRCDRPETIVTMLSQYMSGLAPDLARRLRAAIAHQHVLVLGYSGRDPDVMQVIEEARPASIRWLLHPDAEVSPELRKLSGRLGPVIEVETGLARDELSGLLGVARRAAVARALAGRRKRRHRNVAPEVRERFAAIDRVARNLGLAAVLAQAALYSEAERVIAALGGLRTGTPVAVRLAAASALARQMRFDDAIDAYETIVGARDASTIQRCFALMGEVGALRDSSRGSRAARKLRQLDKLLPLAPPSRERSRLSGRAASERAGIARVGGDLGGALAGYSAARRAFSDSRDLGERLECAVWRADVLRLQGHYVRAHEEIAQAREDSLLYVRYIAQAWALFVSADIDCARGELLECERALELSWEHFFAPGERQSIVWNLLLRSTLERARGQLDDAEAALRDAGARMARARVPRHLAQARLGLERADLARARGRAGRMARHLAEVRQGLAASRHFASRPRYLFLHARLVEAEARRSGRFSTPLPSSSPRTSPSSPCNTSRESCSSRWPGPWPSHCSAPCSSRCSWRPRWGASSSAAMRGNGRTRRCSG